MTKKLLSGILAIVLSLSFFPVLNTTSKAANDNYNYRNALAFAAKNWNSGKGLCAEFVSDCLKAGGIESVYNTSADGLYHDLVDSKLGVSYKLKMTSQGSKTRYVMEDDNADIVKRGDPIFFYCNTCKRHTHVVISNGFNADGYAVDYAHNNAHNGKSKTCDYTHSSCGRRNWTFYVIRMTDENVLYGKKSNVAAPKLKGVTNTFEGVSFSWNAVKGATRYNVYRKTNGCAWQYIGYTAETSYLDNTVKNATEYTYTAIAVIGKVCSQYYGGLTIKHLAAPEIVSAESNGKAIYIKWNKNNAADGYYLYRRVNNGSWTRYTQLSGSKNVVYKDNAVREGVKYSYKVRAVDGNTVSGNDKYGTVAEVIKAPELKAISNVMDGVQLTWNASTGADIYRVYRRSQDNKKWTYLGSSKTLSFTDDTTESGKTYKYTVRADSDSNRGGYDAKGVEKLFLEVPELNVESGKKGINISWDKIDGAKGYYLYQKTADSKAWVRISNIRNNDEYTVKQVELNEDYTYTIKAYNGTNTSSHDRDGVKCTYGSHLTTRAIETIL